jgi:peptide deformylase
MIREILTVPNPILSQVAQPITDPYNAESLARDLRDTLASIPEAHGLAAVQIGEVWRMIAVRDEDHGGIRIYSNPIITPYAGPFKKGRKIELRAFEVILYENSAEFINVQRNVSGFMAVVLQHELDHLNGILYTSKTEPA